MVTREEAKHLRAIEALIKKDIEYFDIGSVEESPELPVKEHRAARGAKRPGHHGEKPVAVKPVFQAKPEAVKPPRHNPPEHRRARPVRELEDAPEAGGFHEGNMPAFLLRK
jgi:hypothetical protein